MVTCYIFGKLLKHVYRPRPDDRPEDPENGPFWKRHRELDNILSNAFMFLPEQFRLPSHSREVIAVRHNLNLHAAVISLHSAACDKIDKHKLPAHSKGFSRARCMTAAHEIIGILKSTEKPKVPLKLVGLLPPPCHNSRQLTPPSERPHHRPLYLLRRHRPHGPSQGNSRQL